MFVELSKNDACCASLLCVVEAEDVRAVTSIAEVWAWQTPHGSASESATPPQLVTAQ